MLGKERRKKERLDAKLFLEILTSNKEKLGRGVLVDISMSGLGIETESDLVKGKEYVIEVEVPLTLKAKVVRQIQDGVIKQYGLHLKDQGVIDKFVLSRILKKRMKTRKI